MQLNLNVNLFYNRAVVVFFAVEKTKLLRIDLHNLRLPFFARGLFFNERCARLHHAPESDATASVREYAGGNVPFARSPSLDPTVLRPGARAFLDSPRGRNKRDGVNSVRGPREPAEIGSASTAGSRANAGRGLRVLLPTRLVPESEISAEVVPYRLRKNGVFPEVTPELPLSDRDTRTEFFTCLRVRFDDLRASLVGRSPY